MYSTCLKAASRANGRLLFYGGGLWAISRPGTASMNENGSTGILRPASLPIQPKQEARMANIHQQEEAPFFRAL
jgi:hypothetical protein